jgi:tetratricopeptide (TPR) repeat protein
MDEARLNLASVLLDYLDYSRALKEFKAVRARFPKNYVAMIGEANSLYGVGKYKEAVALYEDSIKVRDNNPEAFLRAGKIYEEQLNTPSKALTMYLRYKDVAKPPSPKVLQSIQFLQMAAAKKKKKKAAPAKPATTAVKDAEKPEAKADGKEEKSAPTTDGKSPAEKATDGGDAGKETEKGDS